MTTISDPAVAASLGAAYSNPLRYVDGVKRTNPDPFGFQYRGRYYVVATDENGVRGSWSDDLVTWHHEGLVFSMEDRRHYWAPCVAYAEGKFYLYYSCAPEASDDPHDETLMVAVADHPLGPYTYVRTFFDKFSIDPHVVRGNDGERYMFYSTNDPIEGDDSLLGTSIFMDRMVGMTHLAGQPQLVVRPTLAQEMFEANRFGDGRDWYTVEGAAYLRHRDRAYVTYSGNAYVREDYFVGYSHGRARDRISEVEWRKFPGEPAHAPLIARNAAVEGTGHNSIVRGPNLVEHWILYHGREAADPLDPTREQRTMRVDPLYFDSARLDTTAPTWTPQSAPQRPGQCDLFTAAALDADVWDSRQGNWIGGNGEARTVADGPHTAVVKGIAGSYRAQVWIAVSEDASPGRLGLLLGESAAGTVHVVIDLQRGTAAVECADDSGITVVAHAGFAVEDPTAFRLVEVQVGAGEVDVAIDDAHLIRAAVDLAGAPGLWSEGEGARFSAFAATEHVELWGDTLERWNDHFDAQGAFAVSDRALVPTSRTAALARVHTCDHEVATYDFRVGATGSGAVSFVPWLTDADHRVSVDVQQGQARVLHTAAGRTETVAEIGGLAEEFSVRAQVAGAALTLRIGGETVTVPISAGDFAQHVELTDVALTGFETTRFGNHHQREAGQ